jgi:elongation factor G
MDRVGADFGRVIEMIRDRLGANAVATQLPIGAEDGFRGVVDLMTCKALIWESDEIGAEFSETEIPEELRDEAEMAREQLVEAVADIDEDVAQAFLDDQPVAAEQLRKAVRAGTLAMKIVPVLCGTAFKNKGVQPLLDAVVDYLPSPLDVPPIEGLAQDGEETLTRTADDSEPFAALAFKLMSDPHVGHLTYIRVYSGVAKSGTQVLNANRDRKQRLGRLLQMHANKRQELEEVRAGDIAAVVGLKQIATGETLCDMRQPIVLESLQFPEPVISIAIEPKTTADLDKLATSLERLSQEDPSFRVAVDEETGQTIISGMGELHLEIITDRLVREFGVSANVGKPQVAYRESITESVTVEGRFIKQSGGSGDYGVVKIEASPGELGSGFQFENAIKGGVIPAEFISAVHNGCEEAAQSGPLGGYPVVDIRVRLIDGQTHDVDSSERSFKIAGSIAMKNALESAKPVLLEPVMSVEAVTPEEFMGAVQGDLSSRRGEITGIKMRGVAQAVQASVPLATMFGYVNNLRSLTQGRATYTMQFSHYAEVPAAVAKGIVYS